MTKVEFLQQLESALKAARVPQMEIERSLSFFSESIDDRIEDGMSEEEAVESLGNASDIAQQVALEVPPIPKAIAKAKTGSRALNIILLIILSPIWVPIAAGLIATALGIYVGIWAIIVSLWAADLGLILSVGGGIVALVYGCMFGEVAAGLLVLAGGLVCTGIGLLLFFAVWFVTKWLAKLTARFLKWIKSLFVKDRKPQVDDGSLYTEGGSTVDATSAASSKTVRKLYLGREKKIGGVCSGIAEYFGIDSTVVRAIALILLVLSVGIVFLIYLLLWLLIPSAPTYVYVNQDATTRGSRTSDAAPVNPVGAGIAAGASDAGGTGVGGAGATSTASGTGAAPVNPTVPLNANGPLEDEHHE